MLQAVVQAAGNCAVQTAQHLFQSSATPTAASAAAAASLGAETFGAGFCPNSPAAEDEFVLLNSVELLSSLVTGKAGPCSRVSLKEAERFALCRLYSVCCVALFLQEGLFRRATSGESSSAVLPSGGPCPLASSGIFCARPFLTQLLLFGCLQFAPSRIGASAQRRGDAHCGPGEVDLLGLLSGEGR